MKNQNIINGEKGNDVNHVLASGLTKKKALKISELLEKAALIINEVECELHGTDLKYKLLIPDPNEPTIWAQLQALSRLFSKALS